MRISDWSSDVCSSDLELIPERWNAWLRHDPVEIVDQHIDDLGKLKAIWLDCGDHDQYSIHFGMRRLHRKQESQGVPPVYEEFDDDHHDVEYRTDRFLQLLASAIEWKRVVRGKRG